MRVVLAPVLADLGSLGVAGASDLLQEDWGPRAELLEESPSVRRTRVPLPGTRGADGRMRGRPAGAGTGWVEVTRWKGSGLREALSARFTHPRSASLAERRWNLLCHLRTNGVATAEPLAVGARGGGGFARSSVLVTRELAGFVPLSRVWEGVDAATRARLLRAACDLVAKLLRARVRVDPIRPDDLRVRVDSVAPGEPCAEETPVGLPLNRWPAVVLGRFGGGSIRRRLDARSVARMLAPLAREARARLGAVAARRALVRSLGDWGTREERHAVARDPVSS